MEHPPVRFYAAGLLLTALVLFTGRLSYGMATRSQAAEAAASEKPIGTVQAVARTPVASQRAQQITPKAAQQTTKGPGATYVVRAGETLMAIARLHGTDVASIMTANQLVSDQIRAGQQLTIPGVASLRRHAVAQGDTLWEVTVQYGVSLDELLRANPAVDNPGHLQVGMELVIPAEGTASNAAPAGPDEALSLGGVFAWPVTAEISSYFGPRWGRNHAGIDLAAYSGVPIKASRDGKVVLAGTVSGYGLTVILEHVDGTRTLYAHSSKLLVKAGQTVRQGQTIAEVGSTGHSTGPHLHFEVIVNGKPRDPLLYLPKR